MDGIIGKHRPGRFDWEIHFNLPNEADRAEILKAAARKINVSEPLPYERVAQLTDGWSAAELAEIWSEAAILAAKEDRGMIYEDDYWGGLDRVRAQRLEKRSQRLQEDS